MINLPARLEKKLKELIPRARDREQFVADLVEEALTNFVAVDPDQPTSIGGTIHLFTDGGSRGNPGQAAIGCVLSDPQGNMLEEHNARIGIQTNNVAEYEALIAGLKLAKKYMPNHLVCHMDSELVVQQLNGKYQVRVSSLKSLFDEIKNLAQNFPDVRYVHIPRADNFRADKLVNKALDA